MQSQRHPLKPFRGVSTLLLPRLPQRNETFSFYIGTQTERAHTPKFTANILKAFYRQTHQTFCVASSKDKAKQTTYSKWFA